MKNLAPIAISTYSRINHLKQTIEALQKNILAKKSELFIFSDAAKPGDEDKILKIRKYIHGIKGFRSVNIIERKTNSYINNTCDGVKRLLKEYGRCIVLEEDIVTAPGFLRFMNESLSVYEKEEKIFSISGYSPPICIPAEYRHDIFILRRACAWGYGIWQDRFGKISYLDKDEVLNRFSSTKEVEELSKYGEDLINMILLEAAGKRDAFDVKIFYYQYLNDKYTIYPRKSLVRNIGHDGSGMHCGQTNKFDVDLWDKLEFEIDGNVELDDRIVKSNYKFRQIGSDPKVMKDRNDSIQKNILETDKFGENLIFLISQPRAGSTLLQRILSAHSDIHTTAEPWIMLHPLYALKKNGLRSEYDSDLARIGLEDFVSQVPEGQELYLEALRHMGWILYKRALEVSGKRFFLDKTPRYHNIIPELKAVFPEAKFIFLLRNPLAVLSSTLKSWFQNNPESLQKSINYLDIINGPSHIIQGIQLLQKDAVVVRYEELVEDSEITVKAICYKLGIAYQNEMLNYGSKAKPEGRFGDSIGIIKHNNAVPDYKDKWIGNFQSKTLYEFASKYMETLGAEVFDLMGYPYQENKNKLKKSQIQANSEDKVKEATVCQQIGKPKKNQITENSIKGLEDLKIQINHLPSSSRRCSQDFQACSCDTDYLVSAIVSCYNSENFIRGRLEDLEAQTIAQKLEIIVLDSGSEQNERAIVDDFKRRYSNIKYFRNENRETIYAAWNRGVKAASGKYIVNANTDDRLRKDALEIMSRALEEDASVGVVYIDQILTKHPNKTFANYHADGFLERSEANREILVQKNPCGPQVMWRRELHDKIGYFLPDYEVAGDWDFWLRVAFETNYAILHIAELLGLYYYNLDGLEHGGRKQRERLKEINKIKEKYGKLYQASLSSPASKCGPQADKMGECKIKETSIGNLGPVVRNKKRARNILLTTSAAPAQTPFSTSEKRAPIGIGFLISVLRSAGHNVFFIDNYLRPSNFLETNYLQDNDIEFVGIYANTICYRDTLRMLHKLEWFRQTGRWRGKIIVGGPHTTVCLDTIPDFVDYVVQGEGEKAIVDIVEGMVKERVVKYPRIKNLDELPMPAWDYFINMPYEWGGEFFSERPVFSMNTSRGCPFSCQFCSVKSIWGKRYTHFSAERIVGDIEYLIKTYGAKGIYFREDNFTLNRNRLKKFCNLIIERGIKISWACETRVNTIDEETVELMSKAGACGFYFGVESGSQKILDLLKKGIKIEETRRAFQLCHKYGIKTAASIVVGVPNETDADLKKTFALVEEIKPTITWFNVFVGIPNSELYEYTLKNKLYEFVDDRGLVYLKGHNQRVQAFYGGRWDAGVPFFSPNQPKICVVMSVYNGEDYVESAIKSILTQTYTNFEFIIVDDASTDHTPEILGKFDDPRIKIISNDKNLGLTNCLNQAISTSKGEFIARMDADDLSLPHRFEKQLDFLEKNPDYALIGSAYYRINEEGTICQLVNVLTDDKEIEIGLKKQNWFGHGSVMIRRDAFLDIGGYNAQFKYAQDYDLWLRISEKYKVANTAEPLYYWRSTRNNISHEKEKEQKYYAYLAIAESDRREKKAKEDQSKEPIVSVIVPTFNRPQMLTESVKSILSQSLQNFEIVVVNDGGENASGMVDKFKDPRIRYISHQKNKGLAAARNTGIRNASGRYIALLDDDDLFYPEHLETAVKTLNNEIAVIYTDAVRATFDRCGDSYNLTKKTVPYSIDFDRNKLLVGNISPVNCFVFEKSLALKAGLFDEKLSTLEDWDFWIRLSALTSFKHIPIPTVQVNWRNDGTTMTSLLGAEFKKNRQKIYDKYQNEINQIPNVKEILNEFQKIWAQDWQAESLLTSIIILTCNQLQYTKKCLESIFQNTKKPYELIIVDNGSTDGTVEFLESEALANRVDSRIKIIKNDENKGFAGGNNQGMAAAGGDYILLLNNDVVVTSGWLERMLSCAEVRPEIGIVGPRSNYVSGPQLVERVDYDTHTLKGLTEFSNRFTENNAGQTQQVLRVVGFCMLIKRAVIDKIGGMDDRYGLGNFEDDDFSLRAAIAGFQSWIAQDCFVHHFGHRTFIGEKVDISKSLHKNWGVFKEKWGLPADKPYGSPYRLSEMKHTRFDPAVHYYPLDNESAAMVKSKYDFKSAEALYAAIQTNLSIKPSQKVIEDLQNLIASYPEFALAYNDLGVLYYSTGNKGKALKFYERAVQLDPENSNFSKNLADFYYVEMGRVEDALRIYVKILERNSEDVETLLITGHICVSLQNFQDAKVFYRRVLELEPQNEAAQNNLNKLDKISPMAQEPKSAEVRYQEIQSLLNNGDPHKAIASLEELLQSYPDFALAHNDLGVLCYHTGEKQKARQHYERAVQLRPDNINFQKNLADFYCIELGRIEDALKLYVSILQTDPRDVETLMATGQICKALEKPDDARDFFKRVLEIDPLNADARKQIEETERQPSGSNLNSASAEDVYRIIQEKLNTLTPAEGIVELEKLLECYPDFAVGHNDLGVLYYNTGNKEKAFHHYRQAAHLQPENLTLQKNLADFLFVEQGKVEEALQIYVDILARHSDDIETLLITGHICVALQKLDDAKDFYERVLALEPNNEDAKKNLKVLLNRQGGRSSEKPDSLNAGAISEDSVETPDSNTEESENQDVEHKTAVSIVISLDGIQNRVKQCIQSIETHTAELYELILIDNGSITRGSQKWAQNLVKDNAHYQLVKCDKTHSLAQCLNQAVKAAAGEHIVLMHNDVLVADHWLSGMHQCFRTGSAIGVVGPMANETFGIQKVYFSGDWDPNRFEADAEAFYEQNQYRRISTTQLASFCLMFRRTLIDKIGGFDAQLASEQAVVKDFCKRSAAWGFQNLVAGDVLVYHADRHNDNRKASATAQVTADDQNQLKENWNQATGDQTLLKSMQMMSLLETVDELHQKGYYDQAVETLLNAIGAIPAEKRFYLALARILISLKRYQDVLDTLNEMPADAKTEMDSEETGNLNEPGLLSPALVASENHEMQTLELLGYAAEGLENFEAAEAYADRMLAKDPQAARALNLEGILAYRKTDLNSAEQFFEKAIASDPGAGEPYSNLANVKLAAGEEKEALKLFEKGFILSPTDFDIATNYHAFISKTGDYQRAEKVTSQAASLYPNNRKIAYMQIDLLLQQGKYAEALDKIEEAIVNFGIEDGILAAALKVRQKQGPMTIKPSKRKATVSCCMIIKDEEKYLARCLSSIKPIVDEMIVVDTGSADRSKDLATTFGAKVYDLEWQNDFARARNFSLEKASGDWILIMDGDEVISPLDYDHFKGIVKKKPRVPVAYTITTRNYSMLANIVGWVPNDGKYINEQAAAGWIPSIKTRLFCGKDQIWFEGAVHELVDPVVKRKGFETKQCAIPVHHYGRLDKQRLTRKGEVYFEIGEKKMKEMGDDINAIREMAIQATTLEKNEMAVNLWQRLISLNPPELMVADAYINMATLYNRLSNFEQALLVAKKAVAVAPYIKESLYNYSLAELHVGNARAAIKVLEELVNRMPDYPPAQFILSAAHFCLAEKEKGLKIIRRLQATALGPNLVYPIFELAETLMKAQQCEYALLLLGAAIDCDIVNKQILELFNRCIHMKEKTKNSPAQPFPLPLDQQPINFENLPQ